MKIDVQEHGSVVVVVPRGAITDSEVEPLQRVLGTAGGRAGGSGGRGPRAAGGRYVVDMSHVPWIDSAGIEFLLEFAASTPSAGLRPRLAALSDTVREALDLTGTLKRFFRFDTVESAVKSYM